MQMRRVFPLLEPSALEVTFNSCRLAYLIRVHSQALSPARTVTSPCQPLVQLEKPPR